MIRTDPQHRDYAVEKGARRKQLEYEPDDAQVVSLPDEKEKRRLVDDPLFRLEHLYYGELYELLRVSVSVLTMGIQANMI
ncbi:MAG: DUF572 domain-containing protein [Symploca sp. SIO1A3]|nr:DUF572 domain-containing protein [Symploca sp. SIO1A3]